MPQADPVADRLRRAPVPADVRADAWDAFQAATDADDLTRRISALKLPDEVKADLWDIKSGVPLAEKTAPAKAPGLATIGDQLAAKAQLHPNARVGAAVIDAAKGAGAGAMSTILHGGDLLRRGWNAVVPESMQSERIIDRPEVAAYMQPPDSAAGQVGFYGEQAAEFAIPLSRLSKATAGAGLLKRAAIDATSSAGVAGLQSGGDSDSMALAAAGGAVLPFAAKGAGAVYRGATRAAAGAKQGGIGGAVASAIRTVAPSEPHVMMTQALKPRSTKVNFPGSLNKALPELKASEAALGKPIENIDELLTATKDAKARIWSQYEELAGPKRAMGATIDLAPVADAMERSVPSKLKLENPERAKALLEQSGVYRRTFTLPEAEQLLKETNAELDAFYNKYPIAQRKALLADPEAARLDAQAKGIRKAIDTLLDDGTDGGGARELKRRYGALLDVENEATRRVNVANRQQPESLSEQIGAVRAAGDVAKGLWKLKNLDVSGAADLAGAAAQRSTAKFIKEQQTTNALIKRAMAGVKTKPGPIPIPPKRPIAGLLEKGSTPMGAGPDTSGPIAPTLPENINRPPVVMPEPAKLEPMPTVAPKAAPQVDDIPDFDLPDAIDPKAERSFMLRWLADDLDEMPFQKGGTTAKGRRAAYDTFDPEEAHALTFNPHVAGTPTQEMFHALGIKGSRSDISRKLNAALKGKKVDAKLETLADAMREAFDGSRFDWQLVSDETIAKLGVRRRDLRSPITMPNQDDMPDVFSRFFGGSEQ